MFYISCSITFVITYLKKIHPTDHVLCLRFRNLLDYKMPHTTLSFAYHRYSTCIQDKLVSTNSLKSMDTALAQ